MNTMASIGKHETIVSDTQLAGLLDRSPEPSLVVGSDKNIIYANKSAIALFELPANYTHLLLNRNNPVQ